MNTLAQLVEATRAAPDTPGRVQWWEVPYHVGQRWATTIGPAQVTLIADEAGASVLEVDGSPMLASHALVIAVSSEAAQCPQGTEEGEWRLLHALAMHGVRQAPAQDVEVGLSGRTRGGAA
jgi:hypothetical protein